MFKAPGTTFTPMVLLRLLIVLLAAALLPAAAQAPPVAASPLPRLLAERQILTQQYAEASTQRHSFFGNQPSKKDLQEVVNALQGIVDKDEQIVAVLNQTTQTAQTAATQLQATGRDDRNLTAERLAELQNEQQNFRERTKQAAGRERALAADLADARQGRSGRDALIAGLALGCIVLIVLLIRRRR